MEKYTRWYRDGTVSVTQGSKDISGSATYWESAGLNPGDMLTLDNGKSFYEVDEVTGNTTLKLKTAYADISASGVSYAIVRNFTATMPAKIAAQTSELLQEFDRYIDADLERITGKSAYEVAVENGFVGTAEEWLESLKAAGEWETIRAEMTATTSTATTASLNANAAVSTANTAAQTANSAVSTASTASQNASTALETANRASGNADTAVSTANAASQTASSALTTATTANTNASAAVSAVGTLSSLTTEAKSTIVAAVNEVKASATAAQTEATTAHGAATTAQDTADQNTTHIQYVHNFAKALEDCFMSRQRRLQVRGKCIGTRPTAEQYKAIKDGVFTDMYLADYWEDEYTYNDYKGDSITKKVRWMIVSFGGFEFNLYPRNGSYAGMAEYLDVGRCIGLWCSYDYLYEVPFWDDATRNKGLQGSFLYTQGQQAALDFAQDLFGDHLGGNTRGLPSAARPGTELEWTAVNVKVAQPTLADFINVIWSRVPQANPDILLASTCGPDSINWLSFTGGSYYSLEVAGHGYWLQDPVKNGDYALCVVRPHNDYSQHVFSLYKSTDGVKVDGQSSWRVGIAPNVLIV